MEQRLSRKRSMNLSAGQFATVPTDERMVSLPYAVGFNKLLAS